MVSQEETRTQAFHHADYPFFTLGRRTRQGANEIAATFGRRAALDSVPGSVTQGLRTFLKKSCEVA
ncbi:hypothetical protein MICRO8M_110025 [Microbacterium sp. 8M]|nr:hypothetical protein MICRO8M_110025 [Microbacterium sp. 8M]